MQTNGTATAAASIQSAAAANALLQRAEASLMTLDLRSYNYSVWG